MPRYVALFRGINVGKAKRIAMADLRTLLGKLGCTDVQTLLNSGNAVFTASDPAGKLAGCIREAVLRKTGVDALVIVKSAKDMAAVVAGNQLEKVATDPSRLLVAFTNDGKSLKAVLALSAMNWGDEKIHVGKHAAYLWCANGILESKVAEALLKGLKGAGTTRNWATLNKIHALMGKEADLDMRAVITVGGICFIVGALAFVAVFSFLAAKFDYPKILDGDAPEVLPRLRSGGAPMRAVWAIYALLPLLLVPGAVGTLFALPASPGRMTAALVFACLGVLAMCLGLMRWPSIHWELAAAYESAGNEARHSIGATFRGLNLYLGNYLGEFTGELCLGAFFLLSGHALLDESRFPGWLGISGTAFGALFILGAFRNVSPRVQRIADLNNLLLPAWMIILGGALLWWR